MHPYPPVGVQHLPVDVIGDIKFCTVAVSLDEVDVQLLTALQEDADRTNVELARLTKTPTPHLDTVYSLTKLLGKSLQEQRL